MVEAGLAINCRLWPQPSTELGNTTRGFGCLRVVPFARLKAAAGAC